MQKARLMIMLCDTRCTTTPFQPPQEKKIGMDGLALTPAALAEMISLIEEGVISGKIGKDVLPRLLEGEGNSGVRAFVEAQGLVQISGGTRVQDAGWGFMFEVEV
jgi:Asp-tRNA(Asn)/Glu-tRNA(Gln) amidotransferase B subunit